MKDFENVKGENDLMKPSNKHSEISIKRTGEKEKKAWKKKSLSRDDAEPFTTSKFCFYQCNFESQPISMNAFGWKDIFL